MALINCKECGKEISDSAEFCPHCGFKNIHNEQDNIGVEGQQIIQSEPNVQVQPQMQTQVFQQPIQNNMYQQQNGMNATMQQFYPNNFMNNKPATKSIVIIVIAVIIGIIIASSIFSSVQNSKKAIRVNISMTNWYGYVDDILDELGLDFDLVTGGVNCYTGVKKSEFHTEKFGILHTEFSYCKSTERIILRVYNSESDQPLRDPKPGELATFNSYGERVGSGRNSL